MKKLRKADHVREWLAIGKMSSGEIARIVGCHSGFVRAIKQRMLHPERERKRSRKHCKAWRDADPERVKKLRRATYWSDPERHRERQRAYLRRLREAAFSQ